MHMQGSGETLSETIVGIQEEHVHALNATQRKPTTARPPKNCMGHQFRTVSSEPSLTHTLMTSALSATMDLQPTLGSAAAAAATATTASTATAAVRSPLCAAAVEGGIRAFQRSL